jgi:hypothetical protein
VNEAYHEEYRVEYVRDKSTKRIVREFWRNAEGEPSRNDDLPTNIAYDEQGRIREMHWETNGIYHRESGPTRLWINPETEVVTSEIWYLHGKVHREGGAPAVIWRDGNTGLVTYVEHCEMGKTLTKKHFRKPSLTIQTPGL